MITFVVAETLCPALPGSFDHGTITATGQKSGDTATYKCKEGYNLKGAAVRSCKIEGTKAEWSPATLPTCQGKAWDSKF